MAPQHSLAFIRPIQRDGADDNDSSRSPSIPPPCHSSPSFEWALHFLSVFSLFVPAFLSVTPLETRNVCRSLRGLRIGCRIERGGSLCLPPFFPLSFFNIFSPASGFVSQVAGIFFSSHFIVPFFFKPLRPCCLVGTTLKSPTVEKKGLVQATDSIDNFSVFKEVHRSQSLGCCWSEMWEVGAGAVSTV